MGLRSYVKSEDARAQRNIDSLGFYSCNPLKSEINYTVNVRAVYLKFQGIQEASEAKVANRVELRAQ